MKKRFLSAALCCLLALTTQAAFAAADPAEEEAWKKEPAYGKVIKIGYAGDLCTGSLGIAHIMGFYKAEGIESEVIRMDGSRGGGALGVDALGTNRVDISGGHIATMLVPTVNGVRAKFTTGIHSGCKSIYVLTDSPIQSTKELEGKYIAIPSGIGASDHNIALRFLYRDGVDIPKVKWKVTDSGSAVLAMQNGEISAALLSDQFAKKFLDSGTLRIIRSLTFDDDFNGEACCIHATSLDFYEQNPITVKKLTRAHEAASKWIMEHPEEAVKALQAHQWAPGDYQASLEIIKTYNYNISDEATEETLKKIVNDYKVFGLIDSNKDTDAIMEQIWDPVATK